MILLLLALVAEKKHLREQLEATQAHVQKLEQPSTSKYGASEAKSVVIKDCLDGVPFLVDISGPCFEIIMLETGSGGIFCPRGLSHCCRKPVHDDSAGMSFRPARIQFLLVQIMAST